MSDRPTLRQRLAGKWQIPLLVLSLALLAGSFLRYRDTAAEREFAESLQLLDRLADDGRHDLTIELADKIFTQAKEGEARLGPVFRHLARARALVAERDHAANADAGRQIADAYESALRLGVELEGDDFARLGRALEWGRRWDRAIEGYDRALRLGTAEPLDLRKHLFELRQVHTPVSPAELIGELDIILTEAGDQRADLGLWAVEHKFELLDALDRLDEAATLVRETQSRFPDPPQADRLGYLEALLLYRAGQFDEAERLLRTIRNRLEPYDELHARAGWLLGRVVLSDGGPQRPMEALSFFSDVLSFHPSSPYAVASRLGSAEAYALLERDADAASSYRIALEELETLRRSRLVNVDVLRTSLSVMAEMKRQEGQLDAALDYARLARALVDRGNEELAIASLEQLGRIQMARADELEGISTVTRDPESPLTPAAGDEARSIYADAARTYLELAELTTLDEKRSSESSWKASELYTRAGMRSQAVAHYHQFVRERPSDPLVPRALLRIGKLCQSMGLWQAAAEAYQTCYRRFPRTLDGARTLVPLAECYLSMGPGNEERAEQTLRTVLEDSDVFTPEAPDFADAMFLLGEALNRRGAYARAVEVLEEASDRYPQDPRRLRALFLLADSYRQSALALYHEAEQVTYVGELERIRGEAMVRLERARALYRSLINEYEARGAGRLTPLERVYLRHSYLYEADCYFEQRDYRTALKLYEEAASAYSDGPSALAAYVQVINCHVFLGEPHEARAALARALVVTEAIPDAAFVQSVAPEGREDWKRYFQWLGESELF
ncbi:MAG: tetratricopeptide repeat protein [Planctomycetes bacterium]|nr:tetratricopeptide repeat protein [Planctomycetota bacterium]